LKVPNSVNTAQPSYDSVSKKAVGQSRRVVAVSGGFDPLHIGHVRMFQEARKYGNYLVVILNNDNWLRLEKGYSFMPENERKEIIENINGVDEVILTEHKENTSDMSVCNELRKLRPHVFANGGDRKADNIPEVAVCREFGIEMVFNIGAGGKVQSSSWLLRDYLENAPCYCGSKEKFKDCCAKK